MTNLKVDDDQVPCPKCKSLNHRLSAICHSCGCDVFIEANKLRQDPDDLEKPSTTNDILFFVSAAAVFAIVMSIAALLQHHG